MMNFTAFFTPLAPYEIFLICLGAVLGVVILWQIACLVIARYILHMACTPKGKTPQEVRERQTTVEHIDYNDYDNKWDKRLFEVDGRDGKIRGEIVFNPAMSGRSVQKVAVICHGHTMNRLNSLKYANVFYAKGYNVIMYDHRYFGESDGKFCSMGFYERQDLSAVIDLARETFGQNSQIVLHGESMGAVTVLSVLGLRSDIDMVIADCPFSDTESYYRELFEHLFRLPSTPIIEYCAGMAKTFYGYDFSKCSPIADVKRSNVPICFIHGRDDDFIYPHHSQDMYAVCNNPLSELHLVNGAGHARSYLQDNEAYRNIVWNFLSKVESCQNVSQAAATEANK